MDFESCHLDNQYSVLKAELPVQLAFNQMEFQQLWEIHPANFHIIKIHGRLVRTPRWQQAFGKDYHYTGRVNRALPVPDILTSIVTWATTAVDSRLNGVLVNWYDGALGHYIGRHRDSTKNMIADGPIV